MPLTNALCRFDLFQKYESACPWPLHANIVGTDGPRVLVEVLDECPETAKDHQCKIKLEAYGSQNVKSSFRWRSVVDYLENKSSFLLFSRG